MDSNRMPKKPQAPAMGILFVNGFWRPFEVGGAEISSALYAEQLAKRGHRVVVLTPNFRGWRWSVECVSGVTVARFPFPLPLARAFLGFNNLLFAWYLKDRVMQAVKRFGIDIVHVQTGALLPGAALAGKLLRKPVLLTVRDVAFFSGTDRIRGRLLYWPFFALGRALYRHADRVVGVSRYMAESAQKDLRIAKEKMDLLYNLWPPAAAGRPKPGNRPVILYVGRLSRAKGLGLLLDATKIVQEEVPGVRLELIGNSGVEKYLKLAKEKSLEQPVLFLGPLPYQAVLRKYQEDNIIVVPSLRQEPLSRVLIEAASIGKPVVATRVGGSPEVVEDGKTGVLAGTDPQSLADGLLRLLKNRKLRREVAQGIRGKADLFDPERNTERLVRLYRQLLE